MSGWESPVKLAVGALVILVFLAFFFAFIFTSLWPEKVFKRPALTGWRRAALAIAIFLAFLPVFALVKALGDVPFFAPFRPAGKDIVSYHSVGLKAAEAIIILLPWFLLPKLRGALNFRVRWSWVALIFILTVLGALPQSLKTMSGYDGEDFTVLFSYAMLIGVVEETLFRGYAFQLGPERRPRETILWTSLMFALIHHNDDFVWGLHSVHAFFFAVGVGVIRLATGSIGLCILIHGVLDSVAFTSSANMPAVTAFMIAATAVFFFHPSCRRVAEPEAENSGGANPCRATDRTPWS